MAIGDTVQAGLMRVDSSPIQVAGAAQARANQAFGNALGQAAEGYFIGKEKKERAKEIEEELIRQGANPDSAKAISKNPFLQKEHARREEAEQRMNIAKLNARTLTANSKRATTTANQAQNFKERVFDAEQKSLEDKKTDDIAIVNYGQTRPVLPITEETPPEFLPALDPDPFVAPPTTFQGQAPVVARLPKSFQPQAASVIDAIERGELSNLQGNRIINSIQAQAMAEQKPMTPEQLLDYQIKLNKEKRDQAKENREASEFEEENKPMPPADPIYKESAINAIDSAIEKSKSFFATGLTGQALQGFAGTDARDLAQAISTVEAAVGFDRLQEMRDSSKTGGALGAINTKELELLSNSLGSLDPLQKPETLRANLESIKNRYEKILKSVEAEKYAFENGITFKTQKEAMDFIKNFKPSSTQQSFNTIDPADIQSEIERKKQMLKARQMNTQYFDNPNVPNVGNINSGN
jgi:hypothetical protein